ncbi:serine/threonine-protein kinase [Streptomyces sp. SM13]|uniref:serine/threonine-protein kinase n=1 Tax=Streptomyces sp. SM13 TaxID=1983803 RepID=UPI000CD537CE|nr:serine/threonine-protein kinase [Streptomyces sp. SM13]
MLIRGRYRLEAVLGRGGMGEVWRGRDETLGRDVAVKLLSVGGGDETAVARFTAEARTAGRLNHPHTVAVYDFGSADDLLFLVMELVDGHSMATELAAFRRLDIRQVTDWGVQIASGLAAAHREGVVHRDIKPANLLITRDRTVKIGDFGIARFAHDASAGVTSTGMIIGTASYLAPERALGRDAGPPADLYALGCVLYELLTGRPPFTADAPAALLHQHVAVAPVDVRQHRPETPDALAVLVHRLLSKAPEARPTAEEAAPEFGTVNHRAGSTGTHTTRPLDVQPPGDGFSAPTLVRSGATFRQRPKRRTSRRMYVLLGAVATSAVAITVAVTTNTGAQTQRHHEPTPRPTTSATAPTATPTLTATPAASSPIPSAKPASPGHPPHPKGKPGKEGKGAGKKPKHP